MAEQRLLQDYLDHQKNKIRSQWVKLNADTIRSDLENKRTVWEQFVDLVHRNPRISLVCAVVGILFFLIPTIVIGIAFLSTSSSHKIQKFTGSLITRNNIDSALSVMNETMHTKAQDFIQKEEQYVGANASLKCSLSLQAIARIAGILEGAPEEFPLRNLFVAQKVNKRKFDDKQIEVGKDSLEFSEENSFFVNVQYQHYARQQIIIDTFIEFMKIAFEIKLPSRSEIEPSEGMLQYTIDAVHVMNVSVEEAKKNVTQLYSDPKWGTLHQIKTTLNEWASQYRGQECNETVKAILDNLFIDGSKWQIQRKDYPKGTVEGEFNKFSKQQKEKWENEEAAYKSFEAYVNQKFGKGVCAFQGHLTFIGSRCGGEYHKSIHLSIDIPVSHQSALTSTAGQQNSTGSGVINAISHSAVSQTGTGVSDGAQGSSKVQRDSSKDVATTQRNVHS